MNRANFHEDFEKKKPFHLMISISERDKNLPYVVMKKKLGNIMRDLDVYGSAVIFHPFRLKRPERKQWYFSPHFHLVCYGEIQGRIGCVAKKYGWYVKYLKVRKSVFQTFCYLLSHCGVKKGYRSLIWMGAFSYGKLKLEKEPKTNLCPCCGIKLVEVCQYGVDPVVPPDEYFEGFIDSDGWYQAYAGSISLTDYNYAPTRQLNETLKGIAII